MADNAPDKKEIQDAKAALDNYNEALQDSINLAKQLSSQVSKLPETLKFSEAANNNLIKWANNYEKSLKKTLALSERVKTGKVKEKEVTDQINDLTKKYQEYLYQNEASFKSTGRFLLKQKSLKEEINGLEKEEIERRAKLTTEYQRFETLQQTLAAQTEKYNNANNILEKQRASRAMKAARQEIADSNLTLTILEKAQARNEKILNQKKSEKKEVDNVIKSHKSLVESYKKQIEDNKALLKYLREQDSLGNATKKIYDNIKTKITDTLKPLALITAGFELFKKLAFGVSDQVTKIQKNLVLSRDEAYEVRQQFNDIAVASGDAALNTARLVEANIALGKQLGFASRFTDDLNIQFVKLTKQIGLSEEAAGGLAKLSIASGATLEESKNVALETSQALSSQYGIQLNQREVLEEVGKISGQTLAMLKASPQAIAQAVAQSKLLGTNLDLVRKQASSLLDFETSIGNELQAELLTGREINLERARSAALTGDLTTAMQELNNQNIDFNKFAQMNVIAQDKVAAALGLSSDELSDQLLKQQYLGKSVEEVAALEGEEVARRLEALSAQDKFNLAIEKMQDLLGQVLGGPLGKLVDMMANLASSSAFVYGTLMAMAGISLVKLISGLVSVAATLSTSAIAGTATASALTFGLAAAGIIAGIGVVAAAIGAFTADAQSQAQEAGDMFSSKGKTLISPKEGGLFSLSDNDEFAAHPKLGEMISSANRQTVVAQDNSELIAAVASLKEVMTGVKDSVGTLGRKEVTIKANTQVMGTAQLMGNTNLA
jgi:hypothetical protein